jgi:hypothetical protein
MTLVSITRIGPNAIGERVNSVYIQPTIAYGWWVLLFQQAVSRYDAKLLS